MIFFCALALIVFGSQNVLADPPKLLTRAEIEQNIRAHAPIPELGVELFALLVRESEPATLTAAPAAAAANNLVPVLSAPSTGLAIQQRLSVILSTGDRATDQALETLRKRTLQIAMQAALHFKFQSDIAQPDADRDYKRGIEMLKVVVGKGADGVFDALNQAYLFEWGKVQYENELKLKLRALLTRGLASPDANARLGYLHAGLRLLPVESRTDFWQLGLAGESQDPKKARMREFIGVRDKVQTEIYLEFLPLYLSQAHSTQGAGVMKLIAGTQLRDTLVVAEVLNWKFKQIDNPTELAAAVWGELQDAAYSRFNRSGKLSDPQANPLEAFKNEGTPDAPDVEENFFSDVLTAALAVAETKLNGQTEIFLGALFQHLVQATDSPIYAFVLETLLFHIDKKFNEEGTAAALVIEHIQPFLTQLDSFLGPETVGLQKREWRLALQEKTRYVLEEAILRKLGWFPPTPAIISEAMTLLRGELATGPTIPLSHTGRAAFRLLTDTPELFLPEVLSGTRLNPHAVLGNDTTAANYEACVHLLLDLYENLPPKEN